MVIERFYSQANAEYQCNVHEFVSIGEGWELIRLEAMHIRIAYLEVEVWSGALDGAGKRWVDHYYNHYPL
jgi:hypothetical protein